MPAPMTTTWRGILLLTVMEIIIPIQVGAAQHGRQFVQIHLINIVQIHARDEAR